MRLVHLSILVGATVLEISASSLPCVVHFLGLVAVTQPVVKVVPELLQDVHVVASALSLSLISECATASILLQAASLSGQLGVVLDAVQVSALHIRITDWTLPAVIALAWNVSLATSVVIHHTVLVVAALESRFFSTSACP